MRGMMLMYGWGSHMNSHHKAVSGEDPKLKECVRRLYQGDGRRASWKKQS